MISYVDECIRSTNWMNISHVYEECDIGHTLNTRTSHDRNSIYGNQSMSTVYYRWLVNQVFMVLCVFVQINKKLKHVEEERLRRHNEAVRSHYILFHGNRP